MESILNQKNKNVSKLKIKKIRYYASPGYTKPLFNQARGIVEIETDGGIIGIGEGGFKDVIDQCAQMLIGQDPFRIEHIGSYYSEVCFILREEKNFMLSVLLKWLYGILKEKPWMYPFMNY
jgi:hypothetical protein